MLSCGVFDKFWFLFLKIKNLLKKDKLGINLMNIEMNEKKSEVTKNTKAKKNRKTFNKPKESVLYTQEELSCVDKDAFWDMVHDGVVKSIDDNGVIANLKRADNSIDVLINKQELIENESIKVGAPIRFYLEDQIKIQESSENPFVGSQVKALELDLLEKAQNAYKNHEMVNGYVLSEIKGGYALALFTENRSDAENGFGLRGFLPRRNSSFSRDSSSDENLENSAIQVLITNLDLEEGNIVVSRRELLVSERKKASASFFSEYKIGDEVNGVVTSIMPYGAFLDLGSIDAFLHISDISWDKRPRINDLLKEGQEVKAKIIELDLENKKVKISMKDLSPDPWQNIEKYFKLGSEVEGDIVAFADFGAFVKLNSGVEGLIHIGEISWTRIKHPGEFFKIGEHVRAAVLRVDKEARRISLSTKELETSPVDRLSTQFPVGAVLKTKITSIHDFGLFVALDEKSNGLVPRSEISWTRNDDDDDIEKTYKVGQEVEVAIFGYEPKRQRITCSIKRLKEDPWHKYRNEYKRGSLHKVRVVSVTKAGVLCELADGLLGFCPKNHLSSYSSETNRMTSKVGDEIEVVVTVCDPQTQKISLSQKSAVESETKKAYASYLNQQNQSGKERTTLADAFKKFK